MRILLLALLLSSCAPVPVIQEADHSLCIQDNYLQQLQVKECTAAANQNYSVALQAIEALSECRERTKGI